MIQIKAQDIDRAVECLERGEVIVFPTETSYGIGCDATNSEAVDRVLRIKNRTNEKGLPLVIPDKETVNQYIVVDQRVQDLIDEYWPGPLNIIAKVAQGSRVADQCMYEGTQAVRVSSHPFCSTIAKRFGKPIVASSANVSGQDSIYRIADVRKAFVDRPDSPDCVIDGGDLPEFPASTTIKIIGDEIEVIRQGGIEI